MCMDFSHCIPSSSGENWSGILAVGLWQTRITSTNNEKLFAYG